MNTISFQSKTVTLYQNSLDSNSRIPTANSPILSHKNWETFLKPSESIATLHISLEKPSTLLSVCVSLLSIPPHHSKAGAEASHRFLIENTQSQTLMVGNSSSSPFSQTRYLCVKVPRLRRSVGRWWNMLRSSRDISTGKSRMPSRVGFDDDVCHV